MISKPKLLVVDDNRSNLIAMRKLLQKINCDVVQVSSGNEALAMCVTNDFALVLLDIEMPGMDGYEVAELLKGEVSTRHIPIIFLTASYADEAHRRRGYEVGAVDYIQKPVDDYIVLSKVASFFELHNTREQFKLEFARSESMRLTARESEARFRQALIDAPIPIMLHAEDGEVILISHVWTALSGYALQDIPSVAAWVVKAYGVEHQEEMRHQLDALHDQHDWGIRREGRIRAANGDILTWDFRSRPLAPLPDGRRLIVSMALDVTDRILSQHALAIESNKNAMLLNSASDGIHILDAKGDVLQVNDAFCRLLGYAREEMLKMHVLQWDVKHSAEEIAQIVGQLSATGKIFETVHRHKDGHHIDVEINAVAVEINQEGIIYCSARDISDRKRYQEALCASESLLSNALRIAHLGTWEWNILDNLEIWSEQQFRIFGFDRGPGQPLFDTFINAVDPHDRDKVNQAIKSALAGAGQYEVECRIHLPDGKIRHIHCQGEVSRWAAGRPLMMIGTTLDITDQHKREEAQRLAATVFNIVDEGVIVTGPENLIIAVNPAFVAVTGYAESEALGKNPSILSSHTMSPEVYRQLWDALARVGTWQGELWNRRKNGELYISSLSIKLVRDQAGQITHHVGVFLDITEQKKSAELIWQQANFDALTKLANRHMLHDRLQQGIKKAKREGLSIALMLIDLDHFKEVNDTLGHDMGDVLLVEAARRITECVRTSDTVARLGGDEFVIGLVELADLSSVERIAQTIVSTLVAPFTLGTENVYISASLGIAIYPDDAREIDDLLKHADQAMYVAKKAGRNRFSYFAAEMQESAQTKRRLTNDLRGALEGKQFRVYYQPIVDLIKGTIYKAEALIRWEHPVLGLVSPAQFIPLAEESGLINEIGDWVFRESALQVKRWREIHDPDFQISVNKSPVQFRARDGQDEGWFSYLSSLELSGQSIVIEITEGLLMNVEPNITGKLLALRNAGIQVSLDDFGTGYSSLSYLKKFNIDYLKIDQSFVSNLETDSDNLALCESIIVMAHKLGLRVIAEGVETLAQRDFLAAAGCDFAQGYLFSKPVPALDFEKLLMQYKK